MKWVIASLPILGTLFGAAIGEFCGPCCGAWREIARAESVFEFAAAGLVMTLSTRAFFLISGQVGRLRFGLLEMMGIVVALAILSSFVHTLIQRVELAEKYPILQYDGGPIANWLRDFVAR